MNTKGCVYETCVTVTVIHLTNLDKLEDIEGALCKNIITKMSTGNS